ncbi:MAG: hypothetical protein B6I35_09845 [Anaerolineaceae bacterium 4572_32.2]|nr:MAG: hypothetical protein B6I35_09845 [Anaerolineaceae bacterium 4572_32.2]
MSRQLERSQLNKILQAQDIEKLALSQIVSLFEKEGTADFVPDGLCHVDPRDGQRIIYNSARARRPHDNQPLEPQRPSTERPCIICQGQTTGVIDMADLSEGFTFINKNLFPILSPSTASDSPPPPPATRAYGLHFLQWTSSLHDKDWHNMPAADRVVVMERLAALERKLVSEAWRGRRGFVSIVKNYGRLVGSSLSHGHQQIIFSNVRPRRFDDNLRFEKERGEHFAAYMLRQNPVELLVRDYGPAALLVPYFMRRPLDMMLLIKDTGKQYLHELDEAEIAAVAAGWHDAIRAILLLMPQMGRERAYNVVTHNGPGAGLYFEFLPYTQETGGIEHLGLFVCQESPQNAAERIRAVLACLD